MTNYEQFCWSLAEKMGNETVQQCLAVVAQRDSGVIFTTLFVAVMAAAVVAFAFSMGKTF